MGGGQQPSATNSGRGVWGDRVAAHPPQQIPRPPDSVGQAWPIPSPNPSGGPIIMEYRVGTWYKLRGSTSHLASGTRCHPCSRHFIIFYTSDGSHWQVPGTWYQVHGTRYPTHDIFFPLPIHDIYRATFKTRGFYNIMWMSNAFKRMGCQCF